MRINSYNEEEEKFSKLLNDLKQLPQIKAEENFEYNLMIRIQNKNFGNLVEDSESQFNIIKFAIPSAIIAIIILFIIFIPREDEYIENPLMTDPPKIMENNLSNKSQANLKGGELLPTKPTKKQTAKNPSIISKEVLIEPTPKYPLNKNRSVSLDDYISGEAPKSNNLERGNIVKGGEEEFDFNGFLLPQPIDYYSLQKYRRMIDSIRKVEAKRDSLKKFR